MLMQPLTEALKRRRRVWLSQPVTHVLERVAATYGIPIEELVGHRRRKTLPWPRMIAMFLVYELTGLTSTQTAAAFGKADHTTACYARQRLRKHLETAPDDDPVRVLLLELKRSRSSPARSPHATPLQRIAALERENAAYLEALDRIRGVLDECRHELLDNAAAPAVTF